MVNTDNPAGKNMSLPLDPQIDRVIDTDRPECSRWEVAGDRARAMHHFRRCQVRRERRT